MPLQELRKDPVFSSWVAIFEDGEPPLLPGGAGRKEEKYCQHCPGKGDASQVVTAALGPSGPLSGGDEAWLVRAVRCAAPVLSPEGALGRKGVGMYDRMNSIGVIETVVEAPTHDTPPEDMDPGQFERVVEMYRMRMADIGRDERIRHITISKAPGPPGSHPCSQIFATPFIPFRVKAELDGAKAYYSYKERCVFCDMRDEELRAGLRVVEESEGFMAFCPFAPRFRYECWILPKRHMCDFRSITPEETKDLASMTARLLKRMRSALGGPPVGYVLHTAPMRIPRRNHWHTLGDDYHWHIEVVPALAGHRGHEWGSGFYVLDVSPETAARMLKGG